MSDLTTLASLLSSRLPLTLRDQTGTLAALFLDLQRGTLTPGEAAVRLGSPDLAPALTALAGQELAAADIPIRFGAVVAGSVGTLQQITVGTQINITPSGAPQAGSAPPRPPLVVGREDDIRRLKERLGVAAPQGQIQVLTAVSGWPGVGKTTVAAVLAHDPEIAAAFPDGVLWTSLGTDPRILAALDAWGRQLGIYDLLQGTVEQASARLRAMLRERRMLLIVDDVWAPEHAMPFQVGGRSCALLVTTRARDVARALAPTPEALYRLPVLSIPAALQLLAALAPGIVEQHQVACEELVRELEALPLAIQVAGRLLYAEADYGLDVTTLIGDLREGARLLEAQVPPDRAEPEDGTIPTVAVLLQKSTDRLDSATRDRFALLGAFAPKPATFDLAAMAAVWAVDDAAPTMRTLVDRGLLEPSGPGRYWMHALLVTHAISLCDD